MPFPTPAGPARRTALVCAGPALLALALSALLALAPAPPAVGALARLTLGAAALWIRAVPVESGPALDTETDAEIGER